MRDWTRKNDNNKHNVAGENDGVGGVGDIMR